MNTQLHYNPTLIQHEPPIHEPLAQPSSMSHYPTLIQHEPPTPRGHIVHNHSTYNPSPGNYITSNNLTDPTITPTTPITPLQQLRYDTIPSSTTPLQQLRYDTIPSSTTPLQQIRYDTIPSSGSSRSIPVHSIAEIHQLSQAHFNHAENHCLTEPSDYRTIGKSISTKQFVCYQCNKTFAKKYNLKRHETIHFVGGSMSNIKCPKCDSLFTRSDNLRQHLKIVHTDKLKDRSHECPSCFKTYVRKPNLVEHIRTAHPTAENQRHYRCTNCPELRFLTRRLYNIHFAKHHSQYTHYKCSLCAMVLDSLNKLTRHFKNFHIQTAETRFKCKFCPYHVDDLDPLNIMKHYLEHHRKYYLPCFFCKQVLRNSEKKYLHHLRLHCPNEDDLVQFVMETMVTYLKELKISFKDRINDKSINDSLLDESDDPENEKYICSFCETILPSRRQAREHYKRLHLGEKLPKISFVRERSESEGSVENLPREFAKVLQAEN